MGIGLIINGLLGKRSGIAAIVTIGVGVVYLLAAVQAYNTGSWFPLLVVFLIAFVFWAVRSPRRA